MKNLTTPRQLRDAPLTGIGYSAEPKPRPLLFVLGLVLGVLIGAML